MKLPLIGYIHSLKKAGGGRGEGGETQGKPLRFLIFTDIFQEQKNFLSSDCCKICIEDEICILIQMFRTLIVFHKRLPLQEVTPYVGPKNVLVQGIRQKKDSLKT